MIRNPVCSGAGREGPSFSSEGCLHEISEHASATPSATLAAVRCLLSLLDLLYAFEACLCRLVVLYFPYCSGCISLSFRLARR